MSRTTALLLLLLAALLEAGGDALVRSGLRTSTLPVRFALFGAGGLVLFCYGFVVNAPSWDFGRVLGIYVVFFFVIAQLISWLAFGQPPSRATVIGGAFIVLGGAIISMWSN
jgi:drug/metabolite transporter superfamily protein YnfA